jgi:TPR repeat protein
MFLFKKFISVFLFFLFTSSYGQSISEEYNNKGSDITTTLIRNFFKDYLNTSNSNYLCSADEIGIQLKGISLTNSEVMSKSFIHGLNDNQPAYKNKFSKNGNTIKWEECEPMFCSSMGKINEFQISGDKKSGNLYVKTILGATSIITKYKCSLINSQSKSNVSNNSNLVDFYKYSKSEEYDQQMSKYDSQCGKGMGESCYALGMFIRNKDKNDPLGINYLKKSCSLNQANGCVILGLDLIHGEKSKEEFNQGILLLKKSCNLNNVDGCNLGGVNLAGKANSEEEFNDGILMLKKACHHLNSLDGCNLGGRWMLQKITKSKSANDLNKDDIPQLNEVKLMLEKSCQQNNYEDSCKHLKSITYLISKLSQTENFITEPKEKIIKLECEVIECFKTFSNESFEIKYPPNFYKKIEHTNPNKDVITINFLSPDNSVEFFMFTRQGIGNDSEIRFNPNLEKITRNQISNIPEGLFTLKTIESLKGEYSIKYQEFISTDKELYFYTGFKYKDEDSFNLYKNRFLLFRHSYQLFDNHKK